MEENSLSYGIELSDSDWENTPASVKQLVERMGQHIKELEQRLADVEARQQELLEKINRTSKNSSSSPSTDPPSIPKQQKKKKSGLKLGGQPGHKGQSRLLYDTSECNSVIDYQPFVCKCCGEKLKGVDSNPYRQQNRRNSANKSDSRRTSTASTRMFALWNVNPCKLTSRCTGSRLWCQGSSTSSSIEWVVPS
jgi:hypothetical protein